MKVSQLTEILKNFPPDHRVVLDGYSAHRLETFIKEATSL